MNNKYNNEIKKLEITQKIVEGYTSRIRVLNSLIKYIVLTLTSIFIFLKMYGTIDWSWWWVLSPIWSFIVLLIIIILFAAILEAWAESTIWNR